MAGMLFPDIAGALSSGAQAGAASAQNQFLMKDRAARDEIAPLIPRALQGDREALNQIGTRHPDTLMKIAPLLDRADAATRTRAKEASEWTTKAAMGVLSLPPEQRPAAYQAALAEGQRLGYQIDMPPQYDRAVEGRLNQVINQARSVADFLKDRNEGPQAMPPPGGGMAAPGASGDLVARTKQVIGGMESGNRYDAVGPDTGGGKKALGKYQVMDFNVGPWTQEALGRALTPEQFLASPQAQEAVADFKLGQYIKQFGSPEAAARAWFAGAGGMNNAGAKDVLGTSVQGYGQKFAQAFGPGAGGSQVAQGDAAPRADASGNPLPPPAAAPGAMIGGEIDDIRRQVRANGGDLFSKGGQLEIQNGNYVVRSIQNPRQIIGMVPVKPAKEPGAGPFTGTGTEAQALNMLIANGTLTPQQAAELAAGKTITNPADGSVIFMTPSGLFKQPQGGQPMPAAPGGAPAPATPGAGMIPVTPPKPVQMTEGQSNAALYADRMREADAIIAANEKAGMSVGGRALEAVPGGVGNFLQADDYQLFEQARRNFINAVLRRESGAVIADTEFANAEKQYFPRPGDSEAVLKQKAANRRSAIEGIARAAGPAYQAQTASPPSAAPATAPAPAPQTPSPAERGRSQFDLKKKYGLE